jgi:hypothetical protein
MEAIMTPRQRRLRNFLLDAPLQLRFTAVLVLATLLGAGLLGIFLARALNRLAEQAERAVEARAAAAQASHELGNASLSRTLLERFNDPEFTAQLERQSRAIDAAYQAEQVQVGEQRREVARESARIGWLVLFSVGAFALAVLLIGIVLTHRIAGPVFRVKKLLDDLGQGRRDVPRHGLREGDELRELFDSASSLVKTLRGEDETTFEALSLALARPDQTDGLKRVHHRLALRLER